LIVGCQWVSFNYEKAIKTLLTTLNIWNRNSK